MKFLADLMVDLILMIEVIGQGGMDFREREVRVLAGDFLRSPCVGHMIHHNLCHADAWPAFEARGSSGFLKDMRIMECGCHGISVFQEEGGVKQLKVGSRRSEVGAEEFRTAKAPSAPRGEIDD